MVFDVVILVCKLDASVAMWSQRRCQWQIYLGYGPE